MVQRWIVLLAGLAACVALRAAAAEEQLPAVWKPHELSFDYNGFTTRYSCEGLRDKVEQALVALGARRDLAVTPYPCARPGEPELFPSLRIKLWALAPAEGAGAGQAVDARWKTISLGGPGKLDVGDCELAEQIRDEILPLFTIRNLNSRVLCVPHQQVAGGVALTLEVLVPAGP